jgi:hypothetical protein
VGRLEERLLFQQRITYTVQLAAHPLSADRIHSAILIGCLDEHAPAVLEGLLEVLAGLAKEGPAEEELQRLAERYRRTMGDPESAPLELDPALLNELLGYPVKSRSDLLRQMQEMRPEQCARSVQAALETALLMIPPPCPAPRGSYVPYPTWSASKVEGRRFRAPNRRFPWSKKDRELVAGRNGVSVVFPGGHALTVQYDACVGVVIHPGGTVHLIGKDAVSLWIRAAEWHQGDQACDEVVRSAPVSLLKVIPAR